MPNQQRSSLELNDETLIDIEEIASISSQPAPTAKQQKDILKVGEAQGFVSRQAIPSKKRNRSPYVVQKNIKMRLGMAELLTKLTGSIGASSDQEVLELAISALLKQKNLAALLVEYQELVK